MKTIIVDPFPREMGLIFRPNKIKLIKKNFKIINAPIKNVYPILVKLYFFKNVIKYPNPMNIIT